jgi:hypothetical protein
MEKRITITIKGEGISVERKVDEQLASKILSLCMIARVEGEVVEKSVSSTPLDPSHGTLSVESPAEYLNRHTPKRNPDKILAFAQYLKEAKNKDSFHPLEIKMLYRDAGEVLPANLSRDFQWVTKIGWIAPDPKKKGNFYVTNTGTKVLKAGFPKEMVEKTKFHKK